MRPASPRASLPLLAAALLGCAPATQALVLLDTDLDPSTPLVVRAQVSWADSPQDPGVVHEWRRLPRRAPGGFDAGTSDAGALALDGSLAPLDFPASFGITPGDGPHDRRVTLEVRATAPDFVVRRRVSFAFVPGSLAYLRLFLTVGCVRPTTGCQREPCTVQQRCEEQGLTCGDTGSCVDVTSVLRADAGVGPDSSAFLCGAYGLPCCPGATPCASPYQCASGTCARCAAGDEACCDGPSLRADGTVCASTANPCMTAGTCAQGRCQPTAAMPDDTPCGADPAPTDPCVDAPVCRSGRCVPTTPSGVPCGPAPSNPMCQARGVCSGGACGPLQPLREGLSCGAANARTCDLAPLCRAGVCTPRNAADGSSCADPANSCDTSACRGGACVASSRANNYQWGARQWQVCCGGRELSATTAADCGVCGFSCASGHSCALLTDLNEYACTCASANAQCHGGSGMLCRDATLHNGNHCACTTWCPAGTHCELHSGNPDLCVPN